MNKLLKFIFSFIILSSLIANVSFGWNFSNKLSQPTFHPYISDRFGDTADKWTINRVMIKDDEHREGKIALTFDSAYFNNCTYRILDELDKHDAKATFFMTTEWMMQNPDQVKDIIKRGHEVGNHTWHHYRLTTLDDNKIREEIKKGHDYMKELTGIDMSLFRFPFGTYDERTVSIVRSMGYYPIQWYFDTNDWKEDGVENLCNRIDTSDKIIEGSIVLMHNGAKDTPDALPHFFEVLEKKGLKGVRVSDLIYKHNFDLKWGNEYKKEK